MKLRGHYLVYLTLLHSTNFTQTILHNRAYQKKRAKIQGFVSFGLGFCLSRPLPNEKTAKKEKTKNSRKRLIYSFAYLHFTSFYYVRIARLLEKACGNSYLQLKVPSHLISDFVYVLRQQKIDKKEENLNLTYLPILIISHFFLQHFRRISE